MGEKINYGNYGGPLDPERQKKAEELQRAFNESDRLKREHAHHDLIKAADAEVDALKEDPVLGIQKPGSGATLGKRIAEGRHDFENN